MRRSKRGRSACAWQAQLTVGIYIYFIDGHAGYAARYALALRTLIER